MVCEPQKRWQEDVQTIMKLKRELREMKMLSDKWEFIDRFVAAYMAANHPDDDNNLRWDDVVVRAIDLGEEAFLTYDEYRMEDE